MEKKDSANVKIHPMVIFGIALIIAYGLGSLWTLEYPDFSLSVYLGKALIGIGILLVIYATINFSKHETSENCNASVTTLITSGAFRLSRNPVYVGFFIIFLGLSLEWNNVWLLIVAVPLIVAIYQIVIVKEEAYLERKFGAEYSRYKSSVRRWL